MADAREPNAALASEPKGMRWAEFLATAPPDSSSEISDLWLIREQSPRLNTPEVFLYCDSEACDGPRFFEYASGDTYLDIGKWHFVFLHFSCRNCRRKGKTYACAVKTESKVPPTGAATKLGETPPFGPNTPARVITLIGRDRELFLQGRRAENHAMGIGAFAYYRRVVENQKTRIIREIAKVAAKLGAKSDVLKEFEAAAKETQFSTAIEQIKHGIPDVLLIDGQHNPLTLLHSALSEGLHANTDAECLEIAQAIRVVLTELADRISQALKKEAELTTAVSRLLNRKSSNPSKPTPVS
jgi:hypothetical protein